MTWDIKLIALYYWVCDQFETGLNNTVQRYNKNNSTMVLDFTDEEAVTIYLYGILRQDFEVKKIYNYAHDHLLDWFPTLPSYAKFNERLNRLNPVFEALCQRSHQLIAIPDWLIGSQSLIDSVVDSMPIILAIRGRSGSAKVAREIANKGFCASKGFYYHGLKLHHLGFCVPNTLPKPQSIVLSTAAENDNTVFKEQIAPNFRNLRVFNDRIYHDQESIETLKENYNIEVMPCQKRKKGQVSLYADQKLFSTAVSSIKQPVESFFCWLIRKTGIQVASNVRSTKGLLKHIFGRLTAAFLSLAGF